MNRDEEKDSKGSVNWNWFARQSKDFMWSNRIQKKVSADEVGFEKQISWIKNTL